MTLDALFLLIVALVMALVSGANDGATLIVANGPNQAVRPLTAIVVTTLLLAAAPFVGSSAVAETFAYGLVDLTGPDGRGQLLLASLLSFVVVIGLARAGLPTSLTLALVGAIVGSGLAQGATVHWQPVARIIVAAILVPALAVGAGAAAYRLLAWPLLVARRIRGATSTGHAGTFLLQAVGYSLNDFQKITAMLLVLFGLDHIAMLAGQVAISAAFGAGVLLGIHPVYRRFGTRLLRIGVPHSMASQGSSGLVVLSFGAAGIPASSTQAVGASLIGVDVGSGSGRVRWDQFLLLALAWIVTMPVAAAVAAAAALVV